MGEGRSEMRICDSNFVESLPVVEKAVKECEFMSFDLELSGLFPKGHPKPNTFDTVQERYAAASEAAKKFLPIQFGLSCLSWDDEEKQYQARSFSFLIFQRRSTLGCTFLSDGSSIEFLAQHNFGFNKLFKEGITYASRESSQQVQAQAQARASQSRPDIAITGDDKVFIESVTETVAQFVKGKDKILDLEPCNTFRIRILYQELGKRFPELLLKDKRIPQQRWPVMSISKVSKKERAEQEKKDLKEKEEKELKRIGFRRVVELMCEAKKPLLGHNMLLDLCHFYNAFIGALPQTAEEFRLGLLEPFPVLLDTKYMSSKLTSGHTGLEDLYKVAQTYTNPKIQIPEEYPDFSDKPAHEASFDAFCTGYVFVKLVDHYFPSIQHPLSPLTQNIEPWTNQIYLARSAQHFHLAKPSEDISFNNVFHVYGFKTAVNTSDIHKWFQSCGKVQIGWQSDQSAFVTIMDEANLPKVQQIIDDGEQTFFIQTLQQYRVSNSRSAFQTSRNSTPTARVSQGSALSKRPRPKSFDLSDHTPKKSKEESNS